MRERERNMLYLKRNDVTNGPRVGLKHLVNEQHETGSVAKGAEGEEKVDEEDITEHLPVHLLYDLDHVTQRLSLAGFVVVLLAVQGVLLGVGVVCVL